MKTYAETVDFLFAQLPVFQRDGAAAYKPGLENTIALCKAIGDPQTSFKSIHIGGTNGKGSTSHSLASIFQEAGYKTGLYTSPHLIDFRERIRVNCEMITESEVVETIGEWLQIIDQIKPSFFELTVALAFHHFAKQKVEIAIIEVGMGGRLDSTNIITPELSVITNISYDHQKFLGESLEEIAIEKAGIIKTEIPVVISEWQVETEMIFKTKASSSKSEIAFGSKVYHIENLGIESGLRKINVCKANQKAFELDLSLLGNYQLKNIAGILTSIDALRISGWKISDEEMRRGLLNVQKNTGLLGRWQILQQDPKIICDTGHNEAGIKEVVKQLSSYTFDKLWIIWGMVADKDHNQIISLLPKNAQIIVTQPSNLPRALPKEDLTKLFEALGYSPIIKISVSEALDFANKMAGSHDLIFIGGSTFTVADIPFEKFHIRH